MNTASAPGRVVMVVANRIDGDSRVQKSAQSMSEAGWDVHLVGLSVSGRQEHYRQGDVEYHKIPVPKMDPPKNLRRRLAALRYPLAYGDTARVKHGDTRIKAERIELEAIDDERGRGSDGLLRPPRLLRRLGRKVQRFWIGRRIGQTRARDDYAARDDGRIDRFERAWWTLLLGDRVWRRLDIDAVRIELALQPEIIRLEPDLIHAHDMHPIGICARAAARIRRSGRTVKLLYDAHEFVPGCDTLPADRFESLVRYERRYLPSADAIVTVSQPLAELLRDHHGLDRTPAVVLNAPLTPDYSRPDPGDVRSACGLGADTPLGVYSGWAAPERKIEWIIEAAARIPGLHVAFLVNRPSHPYVKSLVSLGATLGVADRLHFRGYVDYADLPRFLSTADVGIHPMQSGPINHEIALPNKFFEYSHARLPLVVSDVKTLSEEVRRIGNGEVFASGDIGSLVVAIEKVLANPQVYRGAYRDPEVLAGYTWERQVHTYTALYEELIGPARGPVAEGALGV
ncbi:glycosyltransferase family 4 protein [Glycomyces sp. NPDC048151]|uniref:glycosyltransferase family 4 protein n=1 Tax=Glycomyces sp. NPDC048151 TaxID=3364002 RepID=UPI00371B24E1